jgi:hypothetical protein
MRSKYHEVITLKANIAAGVITDNVDHLSLIIYNYEILIRSTRRG